MWFGLFVGTCPYVDFQHVVRAVIVREVEVGERLEVLIREGNGFVFLIFSQIGTCRPAHHQLHAL